MKPRINLAADTNAVMQSEPRLPMVNELTESSAASLLKKSEGVRPHILDRRAARWARRAAL